MIKLRVRRQEGLKYCVEPFDRYNDYQKAIRFADTELRSTLQGYIDYINNRYKNDTYSKAIKAMSEANTENEYKDVAEIFASISDYLDSGNLAKTCYGKAEEARKDDIYSKAQKEFDQAHKFAAIATSIESYKIAKELFQSIPGWKEADDMARRCNQKVEEYRAKVKADRLEKERQAELARLKEEKNAKRTKKIVVIALSFILLVIVFTVILNTVIIPNNKYNNALALMNSGEYAQAISAFEALDGYSDSATKIAELNTAILNNKYNVALALMDAGKYTEAISEFETLDGYKDSVNKIEECNINIYGEEVWNKIKSLNVGDTYEFGSYEQDNIKSNGQEDIKWLVLSKKETKILVISKYALDCKPYNTYSFTDGTWGTCTLREWLNNDFINAAFSEDEKVMIPTITVSKYSTGNAIKDQVFLLSIKEANEYFSSDSARQCKPTAYAVANGAYADNSTGNCRWWLLSPSYIMNYAALVYSGGDVDERGDYVLSDDIAVRPAMWIDLNA